jgi:hypothetical protein
MRNLTTAPDNSNIECMLHEDEVHAQQPSILLPALKDERPITCFAARYCERLADVGVPGKTLIAHSRTDRTGRGPIVSGAGFTGNHGSHARDAVRSIGEPAMRARR